MREKVIGVTGHRPDKLGGYHEAAYRLLLGFARSELRLAAPEVVISGMAQGWDQAVADACALEGVRLIAAVPFAGQEKRWPLPAQREYHRLMKRACHVEVVSPGGYTFRAMHVRNEWVVNNSRSILALWNGDATGGTASCVRYAEFRKKTVDNAWERWLAWKRAA